MLSPPLHRCALQGVSRDSLPRPTNAELLTYSRSGVVRGVAFTLASFVAVATAVCLALIIEVKVGRVLLAALTSVEVSVQAFLLLEGDVLLLTACADL